MEPMELDWVSILFRWMHMIAAGALAGSVLFFHVVLPLGARSLDPQGEETVYLRCRRGFKMTVHVSLLLFLISGIYNTLKNWPTYTQRPGLMHGLFGLHLLLGLGALTALMIMLAGRTPRRSSSAWTRWALVAVVLGIAAASTLKSAREWTMLHPKPASAGTSTNASR